MSHLFIKEKLVDNTLDELKARLVLNGNRQDQIIYPINERYSPTISTSTINLALQLAIDHNLKLNVLDVKCAFLNSPIQKQVKMRIEPEIAKYLIELKPDWHDYLKLDGSLLVQLNKALYGSIEAAHLWNNHINNTITKICKFNQSNVDPCLYYYNSNNIFSLILVHVDDILLLSNNENFTEDTIQLLSKEYGQLKRQTGDKFKYLGTEINYDISSNSISVTQSNYTKSIIEEYVKVKDNNYPITNNDLEKFQSESLLANAYDSKEYRSIIMKINYLATHTRPDILLATSILATKSSKPNKNDCDALLKLLGYLKSTADYGIRFSKSNSTNTTDVKVNLYCDASFAIHNDAKSHTGILISLNDTSSPIYSRSIKQKLVTRSSTEAELVSVDEGILIALRIKNILTELNIDNTLCLFQDNMSAITIAKEGSKMNSGNSRHMTIKINALKQLLDSNNVFIYYINTSNMLADILTKPLTGKLFYKFRRRLLNLQYPIEGK